MKREYAITDMADPRRRTVKVYAEQIAEAIRPWFADCHEATQALVDTIAEKVINGQDYQPEAQGLNLKIDPVCFQIAAQDLRPGDFLQDGRTLLERDPSFRRLNVWRTTGEDLITEHLTRIPVMVRGYDGEDF